MTKIKFCGIRSPETAEIINEIRPDFVGFVLAPKFWRCIDRETLGLLCRKIDRDIPRVGVFVDNPFDEAAELLKSGIIDYAQLHGSEDERFIERLQKAGGKVIKAFKIASLSDAERALLSPADYVLLDSGTGSGELFDWSFAKRFGREFFLAGGLCPENAAEAVKTCRPFALDVSSGIETNGAKDPDKMRRFAEAVRSTQI